jgi:signal peptidase I
MSLSEENAHMDVHIDPGDIVIAKIVSDPKALQAGEIITFISFNEETYGEPVTHMIRRRNYSEDGEFLGYTTYGTNKNSDDFVMVEAKYVLGTYAGKLPQVGYFFLYLKTTPGYIAFILVPFLLLILCNGVNIVRLFKQYKKEQTAVMEAEKEQIAEERRQTEQMLRELQALKQQLGLQDDDSIAPVVKESVEETVPETEECKEVSNHIEDTVQLSSNDTEESQQE